MNDKIQLAVENNEEMKKMIDYLNEAIKDLDIVILKIEDSAVTHVIKPKFDNIDYSDKEQSSKIKNIFKCAQYKSKITLIIRSDYELKNNKEKCIFTNVEKMKKEDIAFVIKEKYEYEVSEYFSNLKDKRKENIETMNNRNDFIYRKNVDFSALGGSITIPEKYREVFLNNVEGEIIKGTQINIKLVINDREFEACIRRPNFTKRESNVYQIILKKNIKEFIDNEFHISYEYIMKEKDSIGKGKTIKVPDELKEYIDFYKTEQKNVFKVKLIKTHNNENLKDDEESVDFEENTDEVLKDFNVS
ncbi:MAG: hypothetical protein E6Y83_03855 [Clostridium butyricum]|nr:hypothetical protein [Clostridium butyricum]